MRQYVSGIYAIVNVWNGDRYVGSSFHIPGRWKSHIRQLNKHCHINRHLQAAWALYGQAAFDFIILETCSPRELLEREQAHIDEQSDYNLALFAGASMRGRTGSLHPAFGRPSWNKGIPVPEDVRKKISRAVSIAQTGTHLSRAHRQSLSRALKGRTITPEWAAKISAANKGQPQPIEAVRKLSLYYAEKRREREQWMQEHPGEKPPSIQIHPTGILSGRRGVPSWNKGIPLTAEQRQHLSDYQRQNPSRGMLGKTHTAETRQRLAEGTRAYFVRLHAEREQWQRDHPGETLPPIFVFPPQSEETIRKRADANRGKKRSAEARENISKGLRGKPRPSARGKRPPELGQKIAAAAARKREAREQWLHDHPGQELPPELKRRVNGPPSAETRRKIAEAQRGKPKHAKPRKEVS